MTRNRLAKSVLFSWLCAAPVAALEVVVQRVAPDDASDAGIEGRVIAEGRTGEAEWLREIAEDLSAGRAQLELDPDRSWLVRVEADGFWSQERVVTPGEVGETLVWPLFPLGRIEGRLLSKEKLTAQLEARFEPGPSAAGTRGRPAGRVECPVDEEGAFSCDLPWGVHDLRLRARGFVSHYLWDREVAMGETLDLGELELVPGASVVGRLAPGPTPFDAVRLSLVPSGSGDDGTENPRDVLRRYEERPDERGFFHFTGIPPGHWLLVARAAGLSPARLPVTVRPRAEVRLEQPLVLREPARLDVRVEPAVPPWGGRWTVGVAPLEPLPSEPPERTRKTGTEGLATLRPLPLGSYRITLEARGQILESREIELAAGDNEVRMSLPGVTVEGRVLLGEEPLAAQIWFGGRFGERRVRMESEPDTGAFEGWLPEPGEWEVELLVADTRSRRRLDPVVVEGNPAEVVLRLPDTLLEGEVVDEDGRAVDGARIRASSLDAGGRPDSTRSDAEGRFELAGLVPGPVQLTAYDKEGASESVTVEIEKGEPRSVRLTLLANREVEGIVVAPEGPVAGAVVRVRPELGGAGGGAVAPKTVTDSEGRFRLEVSRRAVRLDVLVLAPGYSATLREVSATDSLTLPVAPSGSSLVVELPGDGERPGSQALLVHGDAMVPLSWLAGWARPDAREPGRWIVPALEPGSYSLCFGRECVSGELPPLGRLVLATAPPPEDGDR